MVQARLLVLGPPSLRVPARVCAMTDLTVMSLDGGDGVGDGEGGEGSEGEGAELVAGSDVVAVVGGDGGDCSFVGAAPAAPLDVDAEGAGGEGASAGDCSILGDAGAACLLVESDSDSGSSDSSSSRSRSRGRRGSSQRGLGAAAGAALVTAVQPLDIDEAERVVERVLVLPTEDAMQLQHDGSIVAIMADTGAVVDVAPSEDLSRSRLRVAGTAAAAGKAAWELEQLHKALVEKRIAAEADAFMADMSRIEEFQIPVQHVSAVVGNNGCDLAAIRGRCGGIMIALRPPSESGGAMVACLGPGDLEHVESALRELTERLRRAREEEATGKDP